MQAVIADSKLKDIFKQAIIEAIEEKREVVHDLLVEVMEDVAMMNAIREGENFGATLVFVRALLRARFTATFQTFQNQSGLLPIVQLP